MDWSWGRILMFFRLRGVWPEAFLRMKMYGPKTRTKKQEGEKK